MRTAGLLALAVLVPGFAHAAVRISEVAWMGSAASSNAEWIELANTGSTAVDLTGWQLKSSSGAPEVTLAGTVSANGFFLLERTSDDAVPGVAADQIYTGSLPNGGTVLSLMDGSGTVLDTADGSDSWAALGGDNITKDTAQRTNSGWVTAAPTPRAATVASQATAPSQDVATTPERTEAPARVVTTTYVPPPLGDLTVSLQSPADTLYLDVPLRFSARVQTKSGSSDSAAEVVWSFGDGSSAVGSVVTKTYRYAGTYVVKVRAQDGSARGESDVVVTVSKARVRIAAVTGDGITIANDMDNRIDLSQWELFSGAGMFRVPSGTTLLPKSATLFPYTISNVPHSFDVRLVFPDGLVAAAYVPSVPAAPQAIVATTTAATSTKLSAPVAGSHRVQGVTEPTEIGRAHV